MASTLILVCFFLIRIHHSHPIRSVSRSHGGQHLETTSTPLNVSAPETEPQWKPCHLDDHWDKTSGTRSSPYNLTLLQLELNCWFVWPEENWLHDWAWFLTRLFFSILSPMEFWFLAAVASGLLSWGHLISSDIVDLIAQILFKLNWAGRWHHWNQQWSAFNWKLSV